MWTLQTRFMKVEQLLISFLLKNKKVNLQNIGTLHLSDHSFDPDKIDDTLILPEDSIHFEFDPNTPLDSDFIEYVMEQTGKIRPLATSDIESYFNLCNQFLNIGKPINLKHLGMLLKNQHGNYVFTQSGKMKLNLSKTNAAEPVSEAVEFSTERPTRKKYKWLYPLLIILFVSMILIIAFFQFKKEEQDQNQTTQTTEIKDSSNVLNAGSNLVDTPSLHRIIIEQNKDSVKTRRKLDSISAFPNGKDAFITQRDSVYFAVAIQLLFKKSDSTIMLDSVRRSFGGSPFIEYK